MPSPRTVIDFKQVPPKKGQPFCFFSIFSVIISIALFVIPFSTDCPRVHPIEEKGTFMSNLGKPNISLDSGFHFNEVDPTTSKFDPAIHRLLSRNPGLASLF